MPASSTSTAALSRTKAQKLRSSCDSCGTAKVKCDRGQPECARCTALSLICVYGRSRQSGKAPRKRPHADLDATTSLSYDNSTPFTVESRENNTTMGFRQTESTPLNFPDPVINTTFSMENQPGPHLFIPQFLDELSEFDSLVFGPEIPSVPEVSSLENRLSTSALEPISTVRSNSDSQESHSCPRESYEIFRDLICPSPSLHAPEANSTTILAQLDQVLHFNRNAIDRLSRLLKCPCAKSGHRAMVHASIVSRILIWYQQAAGWTGASSWGASSPTSRIVPSSSSLPPGTVVDTDTERPPTLAQSTGFAVTLVPLSVGSFNIEDQNLQAAIRNQLVLSELKKTVNLIDLFSSQNSSESSANGVCSLYSHLGAWLRSEHARTVRVLRSRLHVLNENMDS